MTRASTPCSVHGCPNLQPCDEHKRKAWAGSRRRDRTISGSKQQRRSRRILDRDDRCHVCGELGANEVDHVVPLAEGGRDDETNLAPIHRVPCHQQKTLEEAARARRAA